MIIILCCCPHENLSINANNCGKFPLCHEYSTLELTTEFLKHPIYTLLSLSDVVISVNFYIYIDRGIDGDDPQHINWLLKVATERADEYGIQVCYGCWIAIYCLH